MGSSLHEGPFLGVLLFKGAGHPNGDPNSENYPSSSMIGFF